MTKNNWTVYRDAEAKHPFASSIGNEDLIFVSGIAGRSSDGTLSQSAAEQARNCFRKINEILLSSGSSLSEVVWIRPVITHRSYSSEVGQVYAEFFEQPFPGAGSLIIADLIHPEMRVEFDVVAAKGAVRVA